MIAVPLLMAAFLAPQAYAPEITLKLSSGKGIIMKYEDTETVADLIQRLKEKEKIHSKAVMLSCGKDDRLLKDLHLTPTFVFMLTQEELYTKIWSHVEELATCARNTEKTKEEREEFVGKTMGSIEYWKRKLTEFDEAPDTTAQ